MGLKNTYLYKKVYRPVEGEVPADQEKYGLGKTTARELATLMKSIVNCELKDETLCKKMVDILKGQQHRDLIPRFIEAELDASEGGTQIINKTGSLDAYRADVGAVLGKNGPLVMAIITNDNKDQRWTVDNEAELLISRMAQVIYDAWAKPRKRAALQ